MERVRKIVGVLNSVDSLSDSGLTRVGQWVKEHDIAMITAFRGKFVKCVRGTNDGSSLTKKLNMERNRALKATLLRLGYGVTKIDGSYVEGFGGSEAQEVKENSFLVVNLKDDPNFEKNLLKLGEGYCQDSVFIKKRGEDGFLVGTNEGTFPGYKVREKVGRYKPGLEAEFMSRVRGRPFHFGNDAEVVVGVFSSISDKESDLEVWSGFQNNTKYLIGTLSKRNLDMLKEE